MSPLSRGFYDRPPAFEGNTVVEIAVPSGKLITADDLRDVRHFRIEPPLSINYGFGLDAWARLLAQQSNTAYAFVGNSCPVVTRQADGSLVVVNPEYDEEADKTNLNDDETQVAIICTDLWATMMTDYKNWLDHGGPDITGANSSYALDRYTLIDVTPGIYRWTVFSHADTFDTSAGGRIVFARLDLIEAFPTEIEARSCQP
ncbi:hypothetical protein ANMWB30_23840 [Arthrobacter sp. MWB30]|nr:hypothetical protein ANMWB30_23840 [Arthrobacter sp. MWB30]